MHASTRRAIALALGLGLSVPALAQHGRPPLFYEVVSISTKEFTIFPGGDAAEGRDINNLGEVVGWGSDIHRPEACVQTRAPGIDDRPRRRPSVE